MATISRQENNNLFGPTVGDKIRLGNTHLYVQIEKDLRVYGDESVYGGGKTLRDGMGLANRYSVKGGSLDTVITNVTIIDPILGVVKADVGIKDGKIAGIGKAGNPDVMAGVSPELATGPPTVPTATSTTSLRNRPTTVCRTVSPALSAAASARLTEQTEPPSPLVYGTCIRCLSHLKAFLSTTDVCQKVTLP